MTILAIDAGNSRIKWGLHDGAAWLQRGVVSTDRADELSGSLSGLEPSARVVIANVAGDAAGRHIASAVGRFSGQPKWVMSAAQQCGVRSSYAQPAQLGPDRWAALIGARHLCAGPCVVVNAGTTMTVDALSSEGIFLGGLIVAGYRLMRQSLSVNTARLGLEEGRFSYFPDNTGDAIASGALNALAGAIERMSRYMVGTGEDEPMVVISGGDAERLIPLLSDRAQLVDNLVLEGLVHIGECDV